MIVFIGALGFLAFLFILAGLVVVWAQAEIRGEFEE